MARFPFWNNRQQVSNGAVRALTVAVGAAGLTVAGFLVTVVPGNAKPGPGASEPTALIAIASASSVASGDISTVPQAIMAADIADRPEPRRADASDLTAWANTTTTTTTTTTPPTTTTPTTTTPTTTTPTTTTSTTTTPATTTPPTTTTSPVTTTPPPAAPALAPAQPARTNELCNDAISAYVVDLLGGWGIAAPAVVSDSSVTLAGYAVGTRTVRFGACTTVSAIGHEVGHYIHHRAMGWSYVAMQQDALDHFCPGGSNDDGRCRDGWIRGTELSPGIEHVAHCIGRVLVGTTTYTKCPDAALYDAAVQRIAAGS